MNRLPAPDNEFSCETAVRMQRRVLVAGCGYLGTAVARLFHAQGWEVVAITRTQASAEALGIEPFRVIACDLAEADALIKLGRFDAVIHCASSSRGGADAYRRVYLEGARHLIAAFPAARLVFCGSTSVYAQEDGATVNEESPAEPARETGQILRAAEGLILAAGGTVARLGGIYGPERWALRDKLVEGRAVIEGDGSRFVNAIHRADAASAIRFLLTQPPGIYNVVDDTPTSQREVYAVLAGHFHSPLPPFAPPHLERKRGWTHKAVSNAKLRALGWVPIYPSFRDALPSDKE
jgi:nucleoside-diphosphate-sugar epimerase